MVRERQALREVAESLETEADELEGVVTWLCIHLDDADTNIQLQILRDEVVKKRREKQRLVWLCKKD